MKDPLCEGNYIYDKYVCIYRYLKGNKENMEICLICTYLSLNKASKIYTRFIRGQSFFVLSKEILCTTQKVNHKISLSFYSSKGENAKMEMKSGLDIGHFNGTSVQRSDYIDIEVVFFWYVCMSYFSTFIVLFYVLQCSNYGILKMHECLAKRV